MADCRYHEICGLQSTEKDGLCILHSKDEEKDEGAFRKALDEHRAKNRDIFQKFVFPGYTYFSEEKFRWRADFSEAVFAKRADFCRAEFSRGSNFADAQFTEGATFNDAQFKELAYFSGTYFREVDFVEARFTAVADFKGAQFGTEPHQKGAELAREISFIGAQFDKNAIFYGARFGKMATFYATVFVQGADFRRSEFAEGVTFRYAKFLARSHFSSSTDRDGKLVQVFSGGYIDFGDVITDPLDSLVFRDADLTKCTFLGTDLRKAEFTGVEWAKIANWLGFKRDAVCDEVLLSEEKDKGSSPHIERLYRQLKQNYEERREHGTAGDFHYGEKEMLRRNPKTRCGLRFLVTLYWLVSGYGAKALRPLLWAGGLLVVSTLGYVWWGLSITKGSASALVWTSGWDWLRAGFYSFRVMFLLKPDDFFPVGYAKLVHAGESLLGPLLIGLFALALRQRLKR